MMTLTGIADQSGRGLLVASHCSQVVTTGSADELPVFVSMV